MSNAFVLGVVLSVIQGVGTTPGRDDLTRGIEDAEQAVKNFSVTTRFETIPLNPQGADPSRLQSIIATFTVDSARRSRTKYEKLDSSGKIVKTTRQIFDGTTLRVADAVGEPGVPIQFSRISPGEEDLVWPIDPWDFLGCFGGHPVSELLKTHGIDKVEAAEWEGKPVAKITTKVIKADRSYRGVYLVDHHRGFAVVRKAEEVEIPSFGWFERRKLEGRDYVEVADNIWVPQRVKAESLRLKDKVPKLIGRASAVNQNWAVNQTISEDAYKLDLPSGVYVNDAERGTTYHSAKITDQTIVDSEAETRTAEATGRGQPSGRWLRPALITLGSLVLIISLVSLRRRPKV